MNGKTKNLKEVICLQLTIIAMYFLGFRFGTGVEQKNDAALKFTYTVLDPILSFSTKRRS